MGRSPQSDEKRERARQEANERAQDAQLVEVSRRVHELDSHLAAVDAAILRMEARLRRVERILGERRDLSDE